MIGGFTNEDFDLDEISRCNEDWLLRLAVRRPSMRESILAHVRRSISQDELARRVRASAQRLAAAHERFARAA